MRQPILTSPGVARAFSALAAISDSEFDQLRGALSGRRSFSLTEDMLREISEKIGIDEKTLAVLTVALASIYEGVVEDEDDNFDSSDFLRSLLGSLELSDDDVAKEEIVRRLQVLLKKSSNHERFKKIKRLEAGFLPNLLDANSFVDLRPNFNETRTAIEGLIPVIQLNLITNSGDPGLSSITLQLAPEDLRLLQEKLNEAAQKISALRAQGAFSALLLDEQ